jgi:hypothetical protein
VVKKKSIIETVAVIRIVQDTITIVRRTEEEIGVAVVAVVAAAEVVVTALMIEIDVVIET